MNDCLSTLKNKCEQQLKDIDIQRKNLDETLQDLLEQQKQLIAKRDKIDSIKKENDIAKEKRASINLEISKLENQKSAIQVNISSYDEGTNKNIIELNNLTDKMNNEIQLAIEKNNNLRNGYEKDISLYKDKLNDIVSQITEVDKELNSCELPKSNLDESSKIKLEDEIADLQNQIDAYENMLDSINQNKVHNKQIKDSQIADKQQLKELEQQYIQYSNELTEYTQAKEIMLKKYPLWRIENGIKSLTDKMNDFINTVYYKPLNIKFEVSKSVLKMTYNPTGDRDLPISKLSGAEQQIVNLAFIHCFNKELNLGFIALDEVDSACDSERRNEIFEAINNMNNLYKQIFVISHSNEIKDYLKNNCNANVINL